MLVELRAKELVYATVFFAAVVILVFAFAFLGGERPPVDVCAGVLWVTIALAGTLGISARFEREREGDTLRALMLVAGAAQRDLPVASVASIRCSCWRWSWCRRAVSLLFDRRADRAGRAGGLLGSAPLASPRWRSVRASLGRAALARGAPAAAGLSAGGARADCRHARHASRCSKGDDPRLSAFWLRFLVVFDVIFIMLGLWLFEPVTRARELMSESRRGAVLAILAVLSVAGLRGRAAFLILARRTSRPWASCRTSSTSTCPSAWLTFLGAFVCAVGSIVYLFKGSERGDRARGVAAAELTVLFGLCALVTGPLWARKAWGVWWQWDVRLTTTLLLWIIFVAYLFARRYGGPGGKRLAAGLALFGAADVPLIYISVSIWRTIHPKTTWCRRSTRGCGPRSGCRC